MADRTLIIPSDLVVIWTEAFLEFKRQGGAGDFDEWALKTLSKSLLPFLQAAQLQRLVDVLGPLAVVINPPSE